jgi:hypothetical protein
MCLFPRSVNTYEVKQPVKHKQILHVYQYLLLGLAVCGFF